VGDRTQAFEQDHSRDPNCHGKRGDVSGPPWAGAQSAARQPDDDARAGAREKRETQRRQRIDPPRRPDPVPAGCELVQEPIGHDVSLRPGDIA
jgi:hypothetical protein